ncbi:hypothetical protein EVAR_21900_1 [Eumeta japonica]|uniref:Uncharacterized protein n=1 Tax=Eumeta variegata TaxID=151549 RepID=A0A4C1XGI3_EUMVA|nr:hypothetical protein EVAR_21900_1 [Eumeta japonica]
MKDKTLYINVKTKLFNTCVLSVLMYGSQTWALAQNMTRKLETCHGKEYAERKKVGPNKKPYHQEKDKRYRYNIQNQKTQMAVGRAYDKRRREMEQNCHTMVP